MTRTADAFGYHDHAFGAVVGFGLIIDRATKTLAEMFWQDQAPLSLLPGHLSLTYTRNPGWMFGLLATAPEAVRDGVVRWLSAAMTAGLFVLYARARRQVPAVYWGLRWGLLLCFTGSVCNLVDRFVGQGVVDFIALTAVQRMGTLTINVADLYILVGVVLLVRQMWAAPAAGALEE